MKKQLIILATIVVVLSLVVVGVETGGQTSDQSQQPNYTYIQEQEATGTFDSPVIHHTAEQLESAILG